MLCAAIWVWSTLVLLPASAWPQTSKKPSSLKTFPMRRADPYSTAWSGFKATTGNYPTGSSGLSSIGIFEKSTLSKSNTFAKNYL